MREKRRSSSSLSWCFSEKCLLNAGTFAVSPAMRFFDSVSRLAAKKAQVSMKRKPPTEKVLKFSVLLGMAEMPVSYWSPTREIASRMR